MTKVVIVGSSLKIGPAVAGSAGPILVPLFMMLQQPDLLYKQLLHCVKI